MNLWDGTEPRISFIHTQDKVRAIPVIGIGE